MIIAGLCLGIELFLAHSVITVILDCLVGILFVLSVCGNIISGVISAAYWIFVGIVSADWGILPAVWGLVSEIVFNIPIINVIAFACGSLCFSIISGVLGIMGIIFDLIIYILGLLVEIPHVITTWIFEAPHICLTTIRTVFAPLSFALAPTAIIHWSIHILMIAMSYTSTFASFVTNVVADTILITPLGATMAWTQLVTKLIRALLYVITFVFEIFFIWLALIVVYGLYVVFYIISMPLDLILSMIILIGGGIFVGILGTV
jgi:hypothetical protein